MLSNNIHPEDALEMEKNDREALIQLIQEQQSGPYWRALKKEIQSWIEEMEKGRTRLLSREMNEKTISLLSESRIRIETLGWVLTVNEKVIKRNQSWLDRFKLISKSVVGYVKTFVGYGGSNEK